MYIEITRWVSFWYQVYQARHWERLLTSWGLPSDSTSVLKGEPGKPDIKRRSPGILFISKPIISLFKLAIMTPFSIFCWFIVISGVIQKVQRHHDLIKAHAVRITIFIRQRAAIQLVWEVTDKVFDLYWQFDGFNQSNCLFRKIDIEMCWLCYRYI